MRYLFISFILSATILTAGCTNTNTMAGNVYTQSQVKSGMEVQYGTIRNIRLVTAQARDSGLGGIAGAALGGIGGSGVTDADTESELFGVLGGVVGSIVGKKIEDTVNQVKVLEIEVKLDSGKTYAVVQKAEKTQFKAGQKVRVIGTGRSMRIAPIN